MTRHFWVLVHRYCGLYMALFLVIAGLTGSILAFYHELDGWLNPERSPEHNRIIVQDRPLLDPFELRERALKRFPEARIDLVSLEVKPDEVYSLMLQPRLNAATGENFPLGFDSITLNPYTSKEIERNPTPPEQDGYFPLTRKNILQFIYALHYQLVLGEFGVLLFWIAALIWTVDCFVGFYLTLPMRRKQINAPPDSGGERNRTFWSRWKPSWLIKWPASFFRVNFDLHRAFGLWTWLILFIFAWSSVMLEIHVSDKLPPAYDSVMKVFVDYPPEEIAMPDLPKLHPEPVIDFRTARAIGQRLMSEQAKLHGFSVKHETLMNYDETKGTYLYGVCTDRDISGVCSQTAVKFDAVTGKLLWREPISSGEYSGVTVKTWLFYLHMALIWGLPYKLFVCMMGLVITMLSVTGVYIWLKKHRVAKSKHSKSLIEARIKIQP